ncbi:mechanosensitive ion channel family protein [Erythrobacter sp. 3-20A1M]|uniref:mechanosensitive ion channel family protein n=1 Tax=Erythrobacter sp. 3-20A1M TaxID=2653850 RepID=UPI001BFC1F67|nr:mechanosensitive ion channel family protein [Erythrobacter sp. 3-20A1M]
MACRAVLLTVVSFMLAVLSLPAHAQTLPVPEATADTVAVEPDPFGRETPRSTVTALLQALADGDYARAANYFVEGGSSADGDAREASASAGDEASAAALARKFQTALDRGGSLAPFLALSNSADGQLDDGLPLDREQVGMFGDGEEQTAIVLERISAENEPARWLVSSETTQAVDDFIPDEQASAADQTDEVAIAGAPWTDWLLLIGIAVIAFAIFRGAAALLLLLLRKVMSDPQASAVYRFFQAALPPLSLYLVVATFYLLAADLPVSIIARQTFLRYAGIVAWIALAWFALRLVDAIARILTGRMRRAERRQAEAVVTFLRRGAKVALLAIAFIAVLDTIGIDITTGIAALGIGGLALALGAQKTVENLVGSVTLIADRPMQVGDVAKIGDVFGTVEDIGMRSTLVRTNNRTLVSIPNGNLASDRIENFALRDRFLFNQTLGVTYDTDADQMERLLAELRAILEADENIIDDDARVRFNGFGDSALHIEFFAYFRTRSYPESLAMQEALLLAIMRKLDERGIGIAFPTRTVHLQTQQGKSAIA